MSKFGPSWSKKKLPSAALTKVSTRPPGPHLAPGSPQRLLFVDETAEITQVEVSLSDIFESLNIKVCLSKVSRDLGFQSETETPAAADVIADKIITQFNKHQAPPLQLSRERAHALAKPDSYFVCKDEDATYVDDVESKSTESKSTFGTEQSPQIAAASVEDVRQLLYDTSDCDEIEELVFREACEADCAHCGGLRSSAPQDCDYCNAQNDEGPVNAWSAHTHIAQAFGDNDTLLSLAIASSTAVKYNPYGGQPTCAAE